MTTVTDRPTRPPLADDAKMTIGDIAAWLGVHVDTAHNYLNRGRARRALGHDDPWLFPDPDGHEDASGVAYWFGRTVKAWDAARPGRGQWRRTAR
jgi:hypothetical protein